MNCFPAGGLTGTKHAGGWNKLAYPKFILLCNVLI